MGWCLVQTGTGKRLSLQPGSVQVGRAQTAQVKATHQSVSRLHAEIVVGTYEGPLNVVAKQEIRIIDHSSTGHVFLNGKASPGKGVARPLADGDLLSFGVDPVTYRVAWSPVVLSYSSRLAGEEIRELSELARRAGAFLTQDWTLECTHLLIEQLAITPKLLCCIADGGIPVSSSYLRAMAACRNADSRPPPGEHQPKALMGVDAEYAPELELFLNSPRPRRTLLESVWIIFGLRQAHDTLSVALRHSGARVQLLCTSQEQLPQTMEELRLATQAVTENKLRRASAVWFVPGVDPSLLEGLKARLEPLEVPCMSVSHKAVVAGILSGDLRTAHKTSSVLPVGKPLAADVNNNTFAETLNQDPAAKRRRLDGGVQVKQEEESQKFASLLPSPQQQQLQQRQHQPPPSPGPSQVRHL
uniref:Nibrin n=1 Tax=Crypthecodinium cohnii TaxID=2866 RepID=A0A516AGW9_CRYCO|nr:nibrin [Crypthecodinium cohnii]USW07898.1 nibrin [Crypthecodinium cohnii]